MARTIQNSMLVAAGAVTVLCLVELLDRGLQLQLYRLGVYPRSLDGLAGIAFAPLLHGSWYHLVSNSFTLAVLLTILLYAYPRSALAALTLIYLGSGAGIWLFGRESFHYGASGLNHGMMFYIFTSGILRRDKLSIALSMIVFFLYGSMIWSIFPQEPGISYESHFFGAVTGIIGAFLFSGREPLPATRRYDWEDDTEDHGSG